MARKLRKPREGAIYHLIAKGNQGDFIFNEKRNKTYFLECLKKAVEDYQALIYAYCIMGNHYHVVLQNTKANLSEIMHYVGSSFSSHLRKQGRIGHIFSGRYKSIHLGGRERLLYLSKYVHLNPVRAAIVERPEDYDWSSYRFFIWDLDPPAWLYVDWLKEHFKPAGRVLRERYGEFVENSVFLPPQSRENHMTAKAIVEVERFLQDLMTIDGEKQGKDAGRLDALCYEVCKHYGIDALYLPEKKFAGQSLRLPREVFAYIAREYTLASLEEIACKLGNRCPSMVSNLHRELLVEIERRDKDGHKLREEVAAIASRFWAPRDGV